jgi:LysM repeat protein
MGRFRHVAISTVLFTLLLVLSGCNLVSDTVVIQPGRTLQVNILTATPTGNAGSSATITPASTATRTNTPAPTQQPIPTRQACTPRTDWQIYTVVSGDTLGFIAQRTNSTVNALVQANCLVNANSITVGQRLRVPQLPTTPSIIGNVVAVPLNDTVIRPGVTVRFDWNQAPPEATGVDFLIRFYDGSFYGIGTDQFLRDGAQVQWVVQAGLAGDLMAVAYLGAGRPTIIAQTNPVPFDTGSQAPPLPQIIGSVTIPGFPQNPVGTTVVLMWNEAPRNAIRVDFVLEQSTAGGRVISSDTNLADSATGSWTVEPNVNGNIVAYAFSSDGTLFAQSNPYRIVTGGSTQQTCPPSQIYNNPIAILPSNPLPNACFAIAANTDITITLVNPTGEIVEVVFYYLAWYPDGSTGDPDVIGSDRNPADGISITWRSMPAPFRGQIYALVYGNGVASSGQTDIAAVISQ